MIPCYSAVIAFRTRLRGTIPSVKNSFRTVERETGWADNAFQTTTVPANCLWVLDGVTQAHKLLRDDFSEWTEVVQALFAQFPDVSGELRPER